MSRTQEATQIPPKLELRRGWTPPGDWGTRKPVFARTPPSGEDGLPDVQRYLDAMTKWLSNTLRRIGRDLLNSFLKGADSGVATPRTRRRRSTTSGRTTTRTYPGDFQGTPQISYRPAQDGDADPGEIVWTWVPYEEDHTKGKDRPVLIIGRDGKWLLGLQLTSKDHDRDNRQEARRGRRWLDIGRGPWDEQNRPSEVRVNRIIRVDPKRVRRIGAVLDKERFSKVAAAVRAS